MKKHRVLFLGIIALLILSSCVQLAKSSSLDNYLITDVPMIYTEFLIFPQKEKLESISVNQYKSESISTLLFDDAYFLLSCTYTKQQYEQELLRFEKIGAEYHSDLFQYPSYVMLYYQKYYEYVLLDAENNAMIYVAAQSSNFKSDSASRLLEDFPDEYLPINNSGPEICKYDL